jgi:trans-aconitate methyltransferase
MAGGTATEYARLAPSYDTDTTVGAPLRQRVVAKLDLRPADVVLDVGCGTGLCFPLIQERLGAEGRLIGIDANVEMLRRAETRVEANGWQNVSLVHADAHTADLPARGTAALFCLAHDVMQSSRCLTNVLQHLMPGARVAAGGVKWASCWLTPVNAVVWWLNRPYVSDFADFDRPWQRLASFVPSLQVMSLPEYLDAAYVAWGHLDEEADGSDVPKALTWNGERTTKRVRSQLVRL